MYSLNEIEYRALSTEQVINSCFRPERAVIHALSIGACDITEQVFIAVTFRLSYSLLSLLILAGLVGRLRSACGFRLGRRGLLIILEKLKQHLRIYEFGTDCGFCMGGARIFWNVFEEVNSETPEVQAPGRQAGSVRDSVPKKCTVPVSHYWFINAPRRSQHAWSVGRSTPRLANRYFHRDVRVTTAACDPDTGSLSQCQKRKAIVRSSVVPVPVVAAVAGTHAAAFAGVTQPERN